jgi:hypothetical protein
MFARHRRRGEGGHPGQYTRADGAHCAGPLLLTDGHSPRGGGREVAADRAVDRVERDEGVGIQASIRWSSSRWRFRGATTKEQLDVPLLPRPVHAGDAEPGARAGQRGAPAPPSPATRPAPGSWPDAIHRSMVIPT